MLRAEYVSLPALPRPEQQTEMPGQPIYWGVQTSPYIDTQEVQVNLTSTRRALRLAGLGSIVVHDTASAPSETNQKEKPHISDISGLSGGTGLAGGSFSPQKRTQVYVESNLVVPQNQIKSLPNRQWPTLHTSLDMANFAKIIAERKRGTSQTEVFAQALDIALRRTVDVGAKDKLMRKVHLPRVAGLVACALIALEITSAAQLIVGDEKAALTTALTAGIYAIAVAGEALGNKHDTGALQMKEKQWSLSPVYSMPDRYLFTKVAIQEFRFARYRKS